MLTAISAAPGLQDNPDMPVRGICRLCLLEKDLLKSHYMPDALYPSNLEFEVLTTTASFPKGDELKDWLLCKECECLFERNGESHVLLKILPKLAKKSFPLHERLSVFPPCEEDPSFKRYDADAVGLEMDKFAYFTLSVIWRGAVHKWEKSDGTRTKRLRLGGFEEPIRLYLLGCLSVRCGCNRHSMHRRKIAPPLVRPFGTRSAWLA